MTRKALLPSFSPERRAVDLLDVDVVTEFQELLLHIVKGLGVAFLVELEEDLYLFLARFDDFPVIEFGEKSVSFAKDFRGGLAVVVKAGFADFMFEVGYPILFGGQVKDASGGRRFSHEGRCSGPSIPCVISFSSRRLCLSWCTGCFRP